MNYDRPYYICNSEKSRGRNNNISMTEQNDVPVNREIGYIELFVFTERGREPIRDATVTVYARQTLIVGNALQTLTTTTNPIIFGLPVANPAGALIRGPEYYFTTYNLTITKPGYSSVTILNIRIFPDITEKIDVNLIEVAPGVLPIPEQIIEIPVHPRDRVQ